MRWFDGTLCLTHRKSTVAVVFIGSKVREVVSEDALGQWQPLKLVEKTELSPGAGEACDGFYNGIIALAAVGRGLGTAGEGAATFVASGWMVPDCLYSPLILLQAPSFPLLALHLAFGVQGETNNSLCIDTSRWSSTGPFVECVHVSFPQNRERKWSCALSMSQLRNQVPSKLKGLVRALRSGGFALTEPRKALSLPICACWGMGGRNEGHSSGGATPCG